MRPARRPSRLSVWLLAGALAAGGQGGQGQEATEPTAPSPNPSGGPSADQTPSAAPAGQAVLLTLDQERLFAESAFGKASLARELAATQVLETENKQIEAGLITEEQDLTTRRPSLPADEFGNLAAAFDAKVERIRDEQDAKARELARARDVDRQAFLQAVVPVLGQLMADKGAIAILEKSSVILSLTAIEVTDEAIIRVDAVLANGTPPPASP